jgi:hypothetical protein
VIETEISRKSNESEICENRLKWNESEIKIWNLSESEMKLEFRSHESEIREKYNFYKFIIFCSEIIAGQVFESNYFHFTCIISKVKNYFFSRKFQKWELKIIEKLYSL